MLKHLKTTHGVYFVTENKQEFSGVYLGAREREGRVYSDQEVAQLPQIAAGNENRKEWKMREKSANRILRYLSEFNRSLEILDLGCGNGWFTHILANIPNADVYGVDINDHELEQAARLFQKPNLKFVYADVFSQEVSILSGFDVITVNACIQYFEDLPVILNQLMKMLNPTGELHIIDSPFYQSADVAAAKERTQVYYQNLGFPEMAKNYFHHTLTRVGTYEIMYQPNNSVLNKLLRKIDSPFMWLKFSKVDFEK